MTLYPSSASRCPRPQGWWGIDDVPPAHKFHLRGKLVQRLQATERRLTHDDVIPDLIRAANSLNNLTCRERHMLLSRAANAISDYRDALDFMPTNNMGSGDIVFDLLCMAYSIERHATCTVYEAMLEAAAVIRALRIDAVRVRRLPNP